MRKIDTPPLVLPDAIEIQIRRHVLGESEESIANGYHLDISSVRDVLSGTVFPESKRYALHDPFDPEWRIY